MNNLKEPLLTLLEMCVNEDSTSASALVVMLRGVAFEE